MKKILFIAIAFLTVVACNLKKDIGKKKEPVTMTTASGLEYTITEKGNGKKPQQGDKVVVHYTGKLLNDTIFDSSRNGEPFSFKLGAGQVIKGWDEAFQLLQVGDKAILKFGPELGYGSRGIGKIPPNSTLIFDVELIDVIEGIRPWDAKGKDTITTPSGLKYIMFSSNPDGMQAIPKSNVKVHYSGFFTDGKPFDSSVERGQPLPLKVGTGQVIRGWDEGIALLKQGEKAKMIIPYQLAYGENGRPPVIPAKSDLIFDVELVEVQQPIIPKPYDVSGLKLNTTPTGLQYYEVKRSGNANKAQSGKTVKVHYTGYLADGRIFDSSVERGEPIEFPLGQGYVIAGWEEGIALMNIGDKLRLVIPYQLAYGEQGRPPIIPAKADLTFDVELIEVK